MSTIEITRIEDVRAGDVVTVAQGDTRATGLVYGVSHGSPRQCVHLEIDHLPFSVIVECGHWTFVRATREAPDLPTEPGSVITNATIKGVPGLTAILDQDGLRKTWLVVGHPTSQFAAAEDITAWTPAHIVPARCGVLSLVEEPNRCGGCWDLGPHNYGTGCDYRGLV